MTQWQDSRGVWHGGNKEKREASAHHRALWRVEQTLNQPGARARLLHQRYLEEERDLLERAEQADDEHEKARLTADAATFHRYADEQEAEARNGAMKTTADEIRKRMTKALGGVAQKYALVKPEDDEQYPADYQLKRKVAREELLREWRTIESRETAELAQWAEEAAANADALYLSDPVTDAAHES
jgi:vacuolar-type H+-ATPase subunit I/STV1